ncbi:MAG: MBL fold metallo-hydrolase [Proteobacteria bacterium]|nr:MBL fold metallo-hydrolase [Pseudomonadota bacterium]
MLPAIKTKKEDGRRAGLIQLITIMKIFSVVDHGPVKSVEIGYSPFSRPLMTTRVYFVDSILFDSGLRHCRQEVVDWLADQTVTRIYLTHHHEDHSGNAAAIKHVLGVPVYGNAITAEKLSKPLPIFPYQRLIWGPTTPLKVTVNNKDIVETDNYRFQAIHTPGHSRDHTVYFESNHGWLISGDLFLSERIKYFRADEILKDQITSLEKAVQLDFEALFCAHSPRIKNGKLYLAKKLDFLKSLVEEVEVHWLKGLNTRQIMKAIGMKEDKVIWLLCMGNVKAEHMINSAVKLLEEKTSN